MILDLSRKHILIVDDKPTNLKVLATTLTEAGLDIAVATNGKMALQQVANDPPELILLDVLMPEIDGFETCKQLKANPETKDIPIIFMTALSDTIDKVRGLSLGAVDYITKPFETEEVIARINTHLQLRYLSKTVEQKNQQLTEALERLNKTQQQLIYQEKLATIGALTAGIVHELRNPLNFVKNYGEGSVELLDDLSEEIENNGSDLNETTVDYINELIGELRENALTITNNAQRAENVIKDMLSQSRSNGTEKQPTYLNALLDQALKLVYKSKNTEDNISNIQIHKDYDQTIGTIMLISGKMSRAFINLIDNAFYALQKRKQQCIESNIEYRPQLWLKTENLGNQIKIYIRDNGIGIPSDIQNQIFRPFFSTKPLQQGTGLGLSLTREIVDTHGGTLTLQNTSSDITEFIIEIPY
ncbi:sensor histidine kinase [Crocosphaera chwakensis]|uniref:histidine kinase n=1 Tax=Crocosphaera chwakensis CCY0110 TaxID=391612 RepID=A3IRJ3_9CHRO|nr:response regulator [Crocosphaera chwakensis]EAZ90842.1 Response Regulator Receiver Signal Transduction Histidine Kinase [Crocosphaera chwakensis CCY0110]